MDTIKEAGFRLHGSKCSFGRTATPFLGFDTDGEEPSVRMAHEKIKTIFDWQYPEHPRTCAALSAYPEHTCDSEDW